MIAALEPLHEELERVSSCVEYVLIDRSPMDYRDLRLREKPRSSKRLVVSFMRREKRLVGTRNIAKSKILTTPGIYTLL